MKDQYYLIRIAQLMSDRKYDKLSALEQVTIDILIEAGYLRKHEGIIYLEPFVPKIAHKGNCGNCLMDKVEIIKLDSNNKCPKCGAQY